MPNLPDEGSTGLLEEHPYTEIYRVSTGQKVFLPIHQRRLEYLYLGGLAEVSALRRVLESEDLVPREVSPGQGLIGFFMVNVVEGDAGPYQELMVLIEAEQSTRKTGQFNQVGSFVWRVDLNSTYPKTIGVEVWGYPKSLAPLTYEVRQSTVHFDKGDSLSAVCSSCLDLPSTRRRENFTSVTPYLLGRSWVKTSVEADFATRPFDANRDEFRCSEDSEIGLLVNQAVFLPATWIYARNAQAVGFR